MEKPENTSSFIVMFWLRVKMLLTIFTTVCGWRPLSFVPLQLKKYKISILIVEFRHPRSYLSSSIITSFNTPHITQSTTQLNNLCKAYPPINTGRISEPKNTLSYMKRVRETNNATLGSGVFGIIPSVSNIFFCSDFAIWSEKPDLALRTRTTQAPAFDWVHQWPEKCGVLQDFKIKFELWILYRQQDLNDGTWNISTIKEWESCDSHVGPKKTDHQWSHGPMHQHCLNSPLLDMHEAPEESWSPTCTVLPGLMVTGHCLHHSRQSY